MRKENFIPIDAGLLPPGSEGNLDSVNVCKCVMINNNGDKMMMSDDSWKKQIGNNI
jgi:hypothetical protein